MMTEAINNTSRHGTLIFKALVGSHSYGTAIATSDHDYKGVYVKPDDDVLSFRYKEQYEEGKGEVYYEIRRFVHLLQSANPTVMELLFTPEDCVMLMSPPFEAVCYAYEDGKTFALAEFLSERGLTQERCSLVALNHFEHCYALYYDDAAESVYRGIIADDSNDVRLSSVPKGAQPLTIINFNKSAYSHHCRQYREYETWLQERNTQRYVDVQGHQQKIDGKNLLHCRRLLDMALEIAEHGALTVRRPNAQELLRIRRGEVDLERIIAEAETDIARLNSLAASSILPDAVESDLCNEIVLEVRRQLRQGQH